MTRKASLSSMIVKDSGKPIYIQICDVLRQQIIDGYLAPDQKLISSRNLAIEIGVSRSSIVAAFEQLQAEGYIEARQGSGHYVTPMGKLDTIDQLHHSRRRVDKAIEWKSGRSQHHAGAADMRLFPYRQWARCVARIARDSPESLVNTDDRFGDRKLRISIAHYLYEWRGINVSPAQILITAGSIDALEICIRTLLRGNESIGLEDPGYLPLRHMASNMGLPPVLLPIDQNGAQAPGLPSSENTPKLVVLTPSHQFPLGGAMSPGRRVEFLNWAEKTDGWIVEDDYDSEFRYAGKPIPALTGFDRAGRSIYVGSFSKIFSTGLRLGFLVAPEGKVDDFHQTLNQFSSKAAIAMQRPLSVFMDSGDFYRHIRRIRRIYADRRRTLIDALSAELGKIISFEDHQAGIQFTAKLPDDYDDISIAKAAQADGIHVVALSRYYAGPTKQSGLLISFCVYENEEIIRSVTRLKTILKSFVLK